MAHTTGYYCCPPLKNGLHLTTEHNRAENNFLKNIKLILNCLTNIYKPDATFNVKTVNTDKDFKYQFAIEIGCNPNEYAQYYQVVRIILSQIQQGLKATIDNDTLPQSCITTAQINELYTLSKYAINVEQAQVLNLIATKLFNAQKNYSKILAISVLFIWSSMADPRTNQLPLFANFNTDEQLSLFAEKTHVPCLDELVIEPFLYKSKRTGELTVSSRLNNHRIHLKFITPHIERIWELHIEKNGTKKIKILLDINPIHDNVHLVHEITADTQKDGQVC